MSNAIPIATIQHHAPNELPNVRRHPLHYDADDHCPQSFEEQLVEHNEPREWEVATHRVRFEPPNLAIITWKGAVDEDHVDPIFDVLDALEPPRYMLIANISDSDPPNAKVRTKMSKKRPLQRVDAIAVAVSNTPKRVLMEMLLRAMSILTKTKVKTAFFENEDACRAWIAALQKTPL